jgi:hypothetical protein
MEVGVLAYPWVYGGGGNENTLVRLDTVALAEHLQAEILDLQAPQEE